MIDHLSFGVAHIDRSRTFYDNTLGALGYKRLHSDDGSLGYGTSEPVLWLQHPKRPVVAEVKASAAWHAVHRLLRRARLRLAGLWRRAAGR